MSSVPADEPNERSYILEGRRLNQQGTTAEDVSTVDSEQPTLDTEQLVQPDKPQKPQTSMRDASFNYVNSIIGSGVIGIAYAFREAGFGLGLLLLVVMACVTDYSLVLMVRGGHLSGEFTYQGLMRAAFGRPGYIILTCLQFIYPYIAMISYNIIVGDTITKVLPRLAGLLPHSILARREVIMALATAMFSTPLCMLQDIARLTRISCLSLACVLFVMGTIVFRLIVPFEAKIPITPDAWKMFNSGIISAIGIMAFAFMCHHNTFLMYESIENADQSKWSTVTHISLAISWAISAIFGIVGYATFTGFTQGDLLENYCPDDDLMNLSRFVFSLTVLLTFPIECFVAREVVENVVTYTISSDQTFSRTRHATITLFLVFSACLVSMLTSCLGPVLELNGVLAAVPLAYVLPAMCYVKLEEGSIFSAKKIPAFLLALFGVCIAICGIVLFVYNLSQPATCVHVEMSYCYE